MKLGAAVSGNVWGREDIVMEADTLSGAELSSGLVMPFLIGKPLPTGLPPKAADVLAWRLPSDLKPPMVPRDIPSPDGEIPSDPVFK